MDCLFDQLAQCIQHDGQRTSSGHHFEQALFAREQSFGSLAIVDIGVDPTPVDNLAAFIPQWLKSEEEPTVLPVKASQAPFNFTWPLVRPGVPAKSPLSAPGRRGESLSAILERPQEKGRCNRTIAGSRIHPSHPPWRTRRSSAWYQ